MKRLFQILTYYLVSLPINLNAQTTNESYSSSSVFSKDEWYRIAVTTDGIYRIDYSKLRQLGLKNPSNPRIFCNNSGQLSYKNNSPSPDDLKELSIFTSTGSDGMFNEGDYVLFFGKATGRWIFNYSSKEYDYLGHNYSDTAFYFITSGTVPGKRINVSPEPSQQATYLSSQSDALFFHELDEVNLIKSGREWFQQVGAININPGFTDLVVSEKIKYKIRVAARASVSTIFRIYEGSSLMKSIQVQGVNLYNGTGAYAQITDSSGVLTPLSALPVYEIRYFNNGEIAAEGWLDYLRLQGRKTNVFTGSAMQYSDSRSVSPGSITGFSIRCQINNVIVWDISDPWKTKQIEYTKTGDNLTFKTATDSLKTFIVFTINNTVTPLIKTNPIPNQNLHASGPADMIIVTHPVFRAYAEKLADIHFKNSGLISEVVTTGEVYNEFSGGIPDIVAIRNFARMKYIVHNESSHPLKYLLLFGDGSYENKTLPPNNPNFIPTYQSPNSNVYVSSYTSDDFYGLLSDGDGEVTENRVLVLQDALDIGVGRLPVSDTAQAGIIISKIIRYLDPANMGEWRNVITLTADDEDGNIHMSDAEGLDNLIKNKDPSINIEKIYLDAFKQTTTVTGQSYPDVNKAITDRINAGCLIFNYTGHGNERSLAAEGIIKTEDINSWRNSNRLPLFITATCEFSRFDDIEISDFSGMMSAKPSAGEMVLLNKDGGGIALMSTTRIVYSAPNYFLNRNIFNFAFERDASGNTLRLGDIIRLAKNNSGSGPNKRNFSLLGDPALRLSFPWYGKVITDSVNNVNVSEPIDSLKALSLITVAGHIDDPNGNLLKSFNGVVSPLVFDKADKITTLANDGGQVMEFRQMKNVLFSGKTMAKDGMFRFSFMVPRDINYSFGAGKISYYANNENEDMTGNFSGIIVGGFSGTTMKDTEGPDIKLYLNDTLFRNGGITDKNPTLLAIIEDIGGINTSGSGIGHDLTGYIDNEPNNSFLLNNYFENDFNSYKRGKIAYDLSELTGGSHSLTVKAWDNFNNSSEESIIFLVEGGDKFILKNLINYPNPFPGSTSISAEHNRPDEDFDIMVNIFSLNGRIVKIIKTKIMSTGYNLQTVIWDGNDDGGKRVGRGIYPYTVIITTKKGETVRSSGRMIIL